MDEIIDPKKKIINCIQKSIDKELSPFDEGHIETIYYNDVMDIVFFYLSLCLKDKDVKRMDTSDFYAMSEAIWNKWSREKKNEKFSHLCGAYCAGPGPMGGTAGPAEMYLFYYTGFTGFKDIQEFLNYPKEICGGWRSYRGWKYYRDTKVIPNTLPKWKRENNLKKINRVFDLAERILKKMEKT